MREQKMEFRSHSDRVGSLICLSLASPSSSLCDWSFPLQAHPPQSVIGPFLKCCSDWSVSFFVLLTGSLIDTVVIDCKTRVGHPTLYSPGPDLA